MKQEEIKDSILEILKDTSYNEPLGTNPMSELEFQEKASKIDASKNDVKLYVDELVTKGFITETWSGHWPDSSERKARAITNEGKRKLNDGGFMKENETKSINNTINTFIAGDNNNVESKNIVGENISVPEEKKWYEGIAVIYYFVSLWEKIKHFIF